MSGAVFRASRWGPALVAACALMLRSAASAQVPAETGQWTHLGEWPFSATHATLLPTGKVLVFGEFEEGTRLPLLWDPVSGTVGTAAYPGYNIFCAGHSFLADGRLLVTGGHVDSHVGLPYVSVYDAVNNRWTRAPDMNDDRWYPTNTTLPNGDVAVLSGETHGAGLLNELVQVYQTGGHDSGPDGSLRSLTTAVKNLPYYPRTFVVPPHGKLFFAGTRRATLLLDWYGTGSWFDYGRSLFGSRTYGPAVYFDGKVMLAGGGDPPTATAEIIDFNEAKPMWRYTASMSLPRRQNNATLLPDGTVLVTGGSSASGFNNAAGAVKYAEVFDPATEQWTRWSSSRDYHGYHATSLLLPDGRVLHAGGRLVRTAEVFSPPYLFKGPRPTITTAPDVVVPGTVFTVASPEAASIRKVTLIALGSVTHAFDMNQRLLTLRHAPAEGGLSITAPASNIDAPPGPYLLFLVNAQGVPSVGKMVKVPAVAPRLKRAVSFSDVWKYDGRNVDPGAGWMLPAFDDSGWRSGPGQLGYGDGDEGTLLTRTSPSQPSVYFRKRITLDRPVTRAELEVLFDDGVAVWINGVPVFARNVDKGLGFATYASASTTNAYARATVPLTGSPFAVGENVIAAMVKQVGATSDDLTFALGLDVELGNTEPEPDRLTVLPWGSTWKYHDSGLDPGASWATAGYDDSVWASGAGQLGYGDGDEHTGLTQTSPSQTSVYFRKKLTVTGTPTRAHLSVLYDDGIAVYVNGTLVLSRNMDSGLAHARYASGSEENAQETVAIPPGVFVEGENTLAVMVKQIGRTSPDLSFDLSLELGVSSPAPATRR